MTTPYYQDDRVTLYHGDCRDVLRTLPDASVDAVTTDPPYELGFMGRAWDGSGVAYDVAMWAECLRVLKPGGHLLAFGGTRTSHRLTCAIEDAGFEIRDAITWLYGSGFPKSLDVGKAIDRQRDDDPDRRAVGAWLRVQREARGLLQKEVAAHWPSVTGGLTGCVANWEGGFNCPTWEQWLKLRDLIGFGDEMDAEVWRLNGRKGMPGEAWQNAEVLAVDERWNEPSGVVNAGQGERRRVSRQIKARASEGAARWDGWGTALKPASEPIVVARRPLAGTVAANVLAHGTGALNIAATRVRMSDADAARLTEWHAKYGSRGYAAGSILGNGAGLAGASGDKTISPPNSAGRWPSNVVLTHAADCEHEDDGGCVEGCPIAELDVQSGTLTSGANPTRRGTDKFRDAYGDFKGQEDCTPARGADAGGASRFFPTFRYEAKADTAERPRAGDTAHPTVKPLALMRWLVRLVTPPGGVVLDPFAGSGTTAEACIIEGFRCVTIEREADYLPLILHRITRRTNPVAHLTAQAERGEDVDLGLFGLLDDLGVA